MEEFKYEEPNQYEIDMLKGTYNPSELLDLEQKEKEHELTLEEQESKHKREYITKVKVIALNMCGKNITSNPSFMSSKDKNNIIECMKILILESNEEITKKFNDICIDKIFQPNADFENLYNSK